MSEQSRTPAEEPLSGRSPTSHELKSGEPWDASYHDGPAPWDIGRPQPAIVRLADAGAISGTVLDAGCGSGDNAVYLASLGLQVTGFDVAETALEIARGKARERGVEARFEVGDALNLEAMAGQFETVLDCGLFHTFDEEERERYVAGLESVTARGGTLYVLCFGDNGPEPGPHPVSREELSAAFGGPAWKVTSIEPEQISTRQQPDGAPAWLATIERV